MAKNTSVGEPNCPVTISRKATAAVKKAQETVSMELRQQQES
jgi:hypothetical protein